ncbi:hypothetical protein C8R43DRAFT_360340 [Mycena crocata]|nr:hypothetical protein C8R43DRAFT_360340 [Mycena crocata]
MIRWLIRASTPPHISKPFANSTMNSQRSVSFRLGRLRLRPHVHPIQFLRKFSTNGPSLLRPTLPPKRVWIASTCLGVVGLGALGYAGYDAYTNWRDIFPVQVRSDMKQGIKAKHQGDLELSAYYKRKAWDTALSLPIEQFKTEPYLRITGIAVDLAGELEETGKTQDAFSLYSEAFNLIRGCSPEILSGPERLRAVSLAVKLGQLAEACNVPVKQEEEILVWAVEEILKLLIEIQGKSVPAEALDFVNMKMPKWMTKTDVSVPLQELGDFYGKVGKLEYAMPLYLQGISLLISEDGGESPDHMCQGAQLMSNVAELVIRGDPTAERQKYAETWAQKALSILQTARKKSKEPIPICEHALAAALFNAGILREMAGDEKRARAYFTSTVEQAKASGTDEGASMAKDAIRRLDGKRT